MVSLAGIIGNNSIGYRHKFTKVNRAIRNTCGRLLNAAFLKRKHFLVKLENNAFIEVIWGTPDYDRLERCFDRIARGLFRHQFGKSFRGRVKVILGYLDPANKNSASFLAFIKHRAELELRDKQRHGRNQGVFFYQFTDPDEHGLLLLKLCFYEGADIYVSFLPEGTNAPHLLGMAFIEGGIKTRIELEGKFYDFN